MKLSSFALLLSCALTSTTCYAFSPSKMKNLLSTTARATATPTGLNSHVVDADDEAMQIMMNANSCANSDTCSIEDAEMYLNEMLHLQSDCVSGALHSDLICDDVLFPSEVIAGLRKKIQKQVEMSNQGSALNIGFNPIFLAVLATYISTGIISLVHNNPDAFTMQEWMYAFQGGYLDDMLSQYIKYGGLSPLLDSGVIVDDATSSVVLPLTLQEWGWSIRDGYVGKMFTEYQNYGGLMTFLDGSCESSDELMIATTPFTTQEWTNAIRDGYFSNMIEHYFRNGGL